jgi:AraC family transcriptional regulator
MKTCPAPNHTGYYTGRILFSKQQQWGELEFSVSSSSLSKGAEGGAFRRNHKLYVTVGGGTSRTVVRTDGAPEYDGRDLVGHVSFIPAERENRGWYKGEILDCLALEIPQAWIGKQLQERDLSTVEFLPATNRFDPLIFHTMAALREESEIGGPAGRLFVETAASLIALHLLRRYSNVGIANNPVDPPQLRAAALARTIEFMDAHLGSDLSLEQLATVASMPVSSFVRSFRKATRMSPHRYFMERRIERSQCLLKSSDTSIAEIAYQLGFSSQSHFSTVFRRYVGATPGRFRSQFRSI